MTALALQQRGARMFLGVSAGPQASGDGRAASGATLELAKLATEAVEALWKGHRDEIRRCCAPIDKQEALGYLLADALGRPLLPTEHARPVGLKGQNAAKKEAAETAAAKAATRSAVRAATRAAAQDAAPAPQPRVAKAERDGVHLTLHGSRQPTELPRRIAIQAYSCTRLATVSVLPLIRTGFDH